ncbi:MAG: hypothetical protein ABWY55_06885, partial [Microbacterium sp.]
MKRVAGEVSAAESSQGRAAQVCGGTIPPNPQPDGGRVADRGIDEDSAFREIAERMTAKYPE